MTVHNISGPTRTETAKCLHIANGKKRHCREKKYRQTNPPAAGNTCRGIDVIQKSSVTPPMKVAFGIG